MKKVVNKTDLNNIITEPFILTRNYLGIKDSDEDFGDWDTQPTIKSNTGINGKIIVSKKALLKYIDDIMNYGGGDIVIDIETDGTDVSYSKIVGVCLAGITDEAEMEKPRMERTPTAVYVPLYHRVGEDFNKLMTVPQFMDCIKKVYENEKCNIIHHFMNFDYSLLLNYLEYYGISCKCKVSCTLLMDYILRPTDKYLFREKPGELTKGYWEQGVLKRVKSVARDPSRKLKDIIKTLFNKQMAKFNEVVKAIDDLYDSRPKEHQKTIEENLQRQFWKIPPHIAAAYGVDDSYWTYKLYMYEVDEIEKRKIFDSATKDSISWLEVENEVSKIMVECSRFGIELAEEVVEKKIEKCRELIKRNYESIKSTVLLYASEKLAKIGFSQEDIDEISKALNKTKKGSPKLLNEDLKLKCLKNGLLKMKAKGGEDFETNLLNSVIKDGSFNLNSARQKAEIITEVFGVDIKEKTPSGAVSTKGSVIEKHLQEYPQIKPIIEIHEAASQLKSFYIPLRDNAQEIFLFEEYRFLDAKEKLVIDELLKDGIRLMYKRITAKNGSIEVTDTDDDSMEDKGEGGDEEDDLASISDIIDGAVGKDNTKTKKRKKVGKVYEMPKSEKALNEMLKDVTFLDLTQFYGRVKRRLRKYINELIDLMSDKYADNAYITELIDKVITKKRIHTLFNTYGAVSGRFTSRKPNLQNLKRTGDIRNLMKAGEGKYIIESDYSQQELVVFAVSLRIPSMVLSIKQGKDLHLATAEVVFREKLKEKGYFDASPEEQKIIISKYRTIAKSINFGLLYGEGARGLASGLSQKMPDNPVTEEDAAKYIEQYFARLPEMKAGIHFLQKKVMAQKYVETCVKRRIYMEQFKARWGSERDRRQMNSFIRRCGVNRFVQGSSADQIKAALLKLSKKLDMLRENGKIDRGTKICLQVHDAIYIQCAEKDIKVVSEILKYMMINALPRYSDYMRVDLEICKKLGDKSKVALCEKYWEVSKKTGIYWWIIRNLHNRWGTRERADIESDSDTLEQFETYIKKRKVKKEKAWEIIEELRGIRDVETNWGDEVISEYITGEENKQKVEKVSDIVNWYPIDDTASRYAINFQKIYDSYYNEGETIFVGEYLPKTNEQTDKFIEDNTAVIKRDDKYYLRVKPENLQRAEIKGMTILNKRVAVLYIGTLSTCMFVVSEDWAENAKVDEFFENVKESYKINEISITKDEDMERYLFKVVVKNTQFTDKLPEKKEEDVVEQISYEEEKNEKFLERDKQRRIDTDNLNTPAEIIKMLKSLINTDKTSYLYHSERKNLVEKLYQIWREKGIDEQNMIEYNDVLALPNKRDNVYDKLEFGTFAQLFIAGFSKKTLLQKRENIRMRLLRGDCGILHGINGDRLYLYKPLSEDDVQIMRRDEEPLLKDVGYVGEINNEKKYYIKERLLDNS